MTRIVGVVVYFRIKQGTIRKGQTIRMMATGAEYTILDVRLPKAPRQRADGRAAGR